MNTDSKKFLRTNEVLATIVDAKVHANAAGGRVFCIALEIEGGGSLGDHFDFADQGNTRSTKEDHRWKALQLAALFRRENSKEYVHKQVIVVLDERGNPEDYRPPLVCKA